MTPEAAIAALDRALDSTGETVILRRVMQHQGNPSSNFDVNIKVVLRGAAIYDYAGGISLDRSTVVLSPTEMINNQWCWPVKKRDIIIMGDRPYIVQQSEAVKLAGEIVRYDITVEEVSRGTIEP